MRNSLLIGLLVIASSTFLSGPLTAAVEFDTNIPQLEFAAQELDAALNETGKTNLKISLNINPRCDIAGSIAHQNQWGAD